MEQPSLLPAKAVRDMEFEDMLSEQIRRNQLALDACIPAAAGQGFSPNAFGILDALAQVACTPSHLYEIGSQAYMDYIAGFLRVKKDDTGALCLAATVGMDTTSNETEE